MFRTGVPNTPFQTLRNVAFEQPFERPSKKWVTGHPFRECLFVFWPNPLSVQQGIRTGEHCVLPYMALFEYPSKRPFRIAFEEPSVNRAFEQGFEQGYPRNPGSGGTHSRAAKRHLMYARARVCGVRGSGVWPKGLARVLGVPIWACLAQNPNESGTRYERACSGRVPPPFRRVPRNPGTPVPGYPRSRAARRHLMYARARVGGVRRGRG